MTRPGVLVDRLALVVCASIADAALAWMLFHPAAAAILQIVLVAIAVIWRLQLRHRPDSLAGT